jgi:hypothetical protein
VPSYTTEVERVIEQHPRYWVVEKVGEAAVVAENSIRATDLEAARGAPTS